jgi:hypothetical protein
MKHLGLRGDAQIDRHMGSIPKTTFLVSQPFKMDLSVTNIDTDVM